MINAPLNWAPKLIFCSVLIEHREEVESVSGVAQNAVLCEIKAQKCDLKADLKDTKRRAEKQAIQTDKLVKHVACDDFCYVLKFSIESISDATSFIKQIRREMSIYGKIEWN